MEYDIYFIAVLFVVILILLFIIVAKNKKIKNAENLLIESTKYKKFIDAFPTPVFFKNFEDKIIYTNHSFDISFGNNKLKTIKTIATLLKKPLEQMELNYDNDKQKRAIILTSNLYDNNHHLEGKIGTVFDIDNLRKDITYLLTSNQRYTLAIEGPKYGLWDWNILENKFYSSNRWKKIMSYTNSEKPNNLNFWLSLVDARDIARVNEALNRHLSGLSDVFDIEHRIRLSNGSKWVQVRGKVIFDNKIATRMTGLIVDISERKENENTLNKNQKLFASFLENLPGIAFIKDLNSKYTYINRNFENLIEYKEYIGKTPSEIFDTKTAISILENDKKTIIQGQIKCTETIINPDKTTKTYQIYKFCINGENGEKYLCGFGIELLQDYP